MENGREGSGIGSLIGSTLVELHHGRIILQSEVGKGSTSTIYLPQDQSRIYAEKSCLEEVGMKENNVYIPPMQMTFISVMTKS